MIAWVEYTRGSYNASSPEVSYIAFPIEPPSVKEVVAKQSDGVKEVRVKFDWTGKITSVTNYVLMEIEIEELLSGSSSSYFAPCTSLAAPYTDVVKAYTYIFTYIFSSLHAYHSYEQFSTIDN